MTEATTGPMTEAPPAPGVRLVRDGHVATVVIDRPSVRNAVDLATSRQLMAAVEEIEQDPDVWVGILTGGGDVAFSAGADLGARQRGEPRAVIEPFGFAGFVRKPRTKPFVAAVNGYAVGGGLEMALACELVVASPHATFSLPEVRRGLIAGGDCLPFALRSLPPVVAADLALTGRQLKVDEAVGYGLVNEVSDDVMAAARGYADRICRGAPLAVTATMSLMGALSAAPPDDYYALADATQARLMATADAAEGAASFKERREPRWTGR